MTSVRVAVAGFLSVAFLSGCSASAHPETARPGVSPRSSPPATAFVSPALPGADCPPLKSMRGFVTIDYVDFVRYQGRDYVSGLDPRPRRALPASELGEVVFRVRCSLAELNDRTGKSAAVRRDGDAAFLRPGTPVYAVRGWSPRCRLAARHDGRMYLYLAYRNGGEQASPLPCAMRRGQGPG